MTCDRRRASHRFGHSASQRTRQESNSWGASADVHAARVDAPRMYFSNSVPSFDESVLGLRDQQFPVGTGNDSGYSSLNLPLPAPTPSGAGPVPIRGTGAKAALAGGVIGAACGVRAAATYRPRRGRRVCIDSIRTLSGQLECSALHCIGGRKPLASPSVLPEIQVRPPEHLMVQK